MTATALNKKPPDNVDLLNKIIISQAYLATEDIDLNDFINLVVQQIQNLTDAVGVVVELVEKNHMVYRAVAGSATPYLGLRLPISNSISGLCLSQQEILYSEDTETDPRVNIEICRRVNTRSLVVAPLFHNTRPVGVLKIMSKVPAGFTASDIQALTLMAGLISSGIAHNTLYEKNQKLLQKYSTAIKDLKKTKKQLEKQILIDYLTKLPNRNLLDVRMNAAVARSKRYHQLHAIMFLDIDHFKSINDTLGHHMGDHLLIQFGKRLKNAIRATDTVARLGGDEFVILLEDIADNNAAALVANKIITAIQEDFKLPQKIIHITTSIGITFFQNDELPFSELLKQADQALYQAKNSGRNAFCFYEK